jgi:hypothetical protein
MAAVLLVTLFGTRGQALGQQHEHHTPRRSITNKQGSVLELPRTLGNQNSSSLTISRQKSQPFEGLPTRSHALRKQAGYKQVTLTVTDRKGRYVTGLQNSDVPCAATCSEARLLSNARSNRKIWS